MIFGWRDGESSFEWWGGKTFFNKQGDGPPLLLFHHHLWGRGRWENIALFNYLASYFSVYSIAIPGWEKSLVTEKITKAFLEEFLTIFVEKVICATPFAILPGVFGFLNSVTSKKRTILINPEPTNSYSNVFRRLPHKLVKIVFLMLASRYYHVRINPFYRHYILNFSDKGAHAWYKGNLSKWQIQENTYVLLSERFAHISPITGSKIFLVDKSYLFPNEENPIIVGKLIKDIFLGG